MTTPVEAGAAVSSDEPAAASAVSGNGEPGGIPAACIPGLPPGASQVVLVEATPRGTMEQPLRMRRVVAPTIAAGAFIAVMVGLAASLVSQRIAEQQAVHDVAQLTDVLADSVLQPALIDQMPADPTRTRQVLDPLVRSRLLSSSLVRVKLWTPAGTILYSDEPRLIGQTFPLEPEARGALTSARTEAGISDLGRPENRLEPDRGKLLEVYRPLWTPNGEPLLFETYFRYDTVTDRSHQLWRGFGGVLLSSLAALLLLLLPLGGANGGPGPARRRTS